MFWGVTREKERTDVGFGEKGRKKQDWGGFGKEGKRRELRAVTQMRAKLLLLLLLQLLFSLPLSHTCSAAGEHLNPP